MSKCSSPPSVYYSEPVCILVVYCQCHCFPDNHVAHIAFSFFGIIFIQCNCQVSLLPPTKHPRSTCLHSSSLFIYLFICLVVFFLFIHFYLFIYPLFIYLFIHSTGFWLCIDSFFFLKKKIKKLFYKLINE